MAQRDVIRTRMGKVVGVIDDEFALVSSDELLSALMASRPATLPFRWLSESSEEVHEVSVRLVAVGEPEEYASAFEEWLNDNGHHRGNQRENAE